MVVDYGNVLSPEEIIYSLFDTWQLRVLEVIDQYDRLFVHVRPNQSQRINDRAVKVTVEECKRNLSRYI